ncbi:hypothetical protein BGX34_000311 [Mortierella sp. NVP85]|nr:hypothetical protein BGX34_000311 [Mortierella sp. NVP85]
MDRSDGEEDAHDDVVDAAIQSREHGGAKMGGGKVLFLRTMTSPSVSYSVPEDAAQEDQDESEEEDDADDDIE